MADDDVAMADASADVAMADGADGAAGQLIPDDVSEDSYVSEGLSEAASAGSSVPPSISEANATAGSGSQVGGSRAASQGAPSTPGSRVSLQPNADWAGQQAPAVGGDPVREDAFILEKLEACKLGQLWEIFNKAMEAGYIAAGEVVKLDWISDWELLVECKGKEQCRILFCCGESWWVWEVLLHCGRRYVGGEVICYEVLCNHVIVTQSRYPVRSCLFFPPKHLEGRSTLTTCSFPPSRRQSDGRCEREIPEWRYPETGCRGSRHLALPQRACGDTEGLDHRHQA